MGTMTWIYTDYPPPKPPPPPITPFGRCNSQSPERRWDARGWVDSYVQQMAFRQLVPSSPVENAAVLNENVVRIGAGPHRDPQESEPKDRIAHRAQAYHRLR